MKRNPGAILQRLLPEIFECMKRTGIFFDKDGTLLENMPYNVAPERIHMASYAERGLAALAGMDADLFIVTNQPGVALGYFPLSALDEVELVMSRIFMRNGVRLAGFYYCPHYPDGEVTRYAVHCSCRKPAPGLLLRAAQEHGIDLRCSWMVGDILHDVEAGRRAGCRTILIDNGNETEWHLNALRTPDYIAADLEHAAMHILTHRHEVSP